MEEIQYTLIHHSARISVGLEEVVKVCMAISGPAGKENSPSEGGGVLKPGSEICSLFSFSDLNPLRIFCHSLSLSLSLYLFCTERRDKAKATTSLFNQAPLTAPYDLAHNPWSCHRPMVPPPNMLHSKRVNGALPSPTHTTANGRD